MFIKESVDIKTIRPGDPLWHIQHKFITTPRAGFEMSKECPQEYKKIIITCVKNGWLTPVAYMRGSEATMEYLK